MIAKGRSINVTLIFSLRRYAEVAESYIRGIERLVAEGGDPSTVASVASFFVSRIDTEADRRLDELGSAAAAAIRKLKGKLAIANARLAYRHYLEAFGGPRWEYLAGKGATAAAGAVGLDLDQEPRLPGHAVRGRADRTRHRQHDARGDDRGLPGSRQAAAAPAERGRGGRAR